MLKINRQGITEMLKELSRLQERDGEMVMVPPPHHLIMEAGKPTIFRVFHVEDETWIRYELEGE